MNRTYKKTFLFPNDRRDFILYSFAIFLFLLTLSRIIFSNPVTSVSISSKEISSFLTSPIDMLSQLNNKNNLPAIINHGDREKKDIALTFDADITPWMKMMFDTGQIQSYYDSRVTTILNQTHTKATFFLTGMWIEMYPNVTKEFAANPLFELSNHTYSHPSMDGYCFDQPQIPVSQYPFEIEKTQQLLLSVAHVNNRYFRFPGGCYNKQDLDLVRKEGLQVVHWDSVANDGFNSNTQQIIANVISSVQNGSIIVLHIGGSTNTPATADALPAIIQTLTQRGYTFVKVSELLDSHPQLSQSILTDQLISGEGLNIQTRLIN